MGQFVNADEIYAMAIQMEDNGARFYRKAAEQHDEAREKDYLLKLASMEDRHRSVFEDMRREARSESEAGAELKPEGGLFFSAIAGGLNVEGSPSASAALTGNESMVDILTMALELEKKSILLYVGIKDVVTDASARENLDTIIQEEKSHVATLAGELARHRQA